MTDNPNAEIIAIGTELLLGEITDTNSVFMARAFRDIGVNVFYMTTVGDNLQRIVDAIDLALDRAEVIITCGGLGPTVDDMTRQAVANATKRELVFQQDLFDTIAERFQGFGVTMTANNRQQAFLPADAKVIENPVGTAPSFIVETERGVVISLPGVPREMKYLMNSAVVPYLLETYNLGVIIARTLKTAGIGESSLDDRIGTELLNQSNPSVGLAAHHGSVDVRITAKAETESIALKMIAETQVALEERIGNFIYGIDNATLEDVVRAFLQNYDLKISIIEAGLPNAIISTLNDSKLFKHSEILAHPDDAYSKFGIDESVMLKDCAIQLANDLYKQGDIAASIALLSYPEVNESADVEQASAIAIMTGGTPRVRVYGFGGQSNLAHEWIPRWGLSSLWRMLKEQYEEAQ